ncbi:MAG: cytochrome c biogenesis protein ResB, partial [Spirochaetota bacterium]
TTITSILATLIPQGRELAFYYHSYSRLVSWLIVTLQLNNFFRSILFLFPVSLFFVNLAVCTIDRLIKGLKSGRKRYGPDFIHVGLLLLVIGSILTFTGRREGFMTLGEGDEIRLPGGYLLTLKKFEFRKYADGRSKDWISTVDVEKDGNPIIKDFPIEVNKPLKIGSIKIYQNSYSKEDQLTLKDADGQKYTIVPGQQLSSATTIYLFTGIEDNSEGSGLRKAVFEKWESKTMTAIVKVSTREELEEYKIEELFSRDLTGLQAVIDPGFIPVLIALIIMAFGLVLTYLQKIGDKII